MVMHNKKFLLLALFMGSVLSLLVILAQPRLSHSAAAVMGAITAVVMVVVFAILERITQHSFEQHERDPLSKSHLSWWILIYILFFNGLPGLSFHISDTILGLVNGYNITLITESSSLSFLFQHFLFSIYTINYVFGGFILTNAIRLKRYSGILLSVLSLFIFNIIVLFYMSDATLKTFETDFNTIPPIRSIQFWPIYLFCTFVGLVCGSLFTRIFRVQESSSSKDADLYDFNSSFLYSAQSLLAIFAISIAMLAGWIYLQLFNPALLPISIIYFYLDFFIAFAMLILMVILEIITRVRKTSFQVNDMFSSTQLFFLFVVFTVIFIGSQNYIYPAHMGVVTILQHVLPDFVRPWWETGYRIWHALIPLICAFVIVKIAKIRTFTMVLCATMAALLTHPAIIICSEIVVRGTFTQNAILFAFQASSEEHWALFFLGSTMGTALAMLFSGKTSEEDEEYA